MGRLIQNPHFSETLEQHHNVFQYSPAGAIDVPAVLVGLLFNAKKQTKGETV
jgi:hypothetical protein